MKVNAISSSFYTVKKSAAKNRVNHNSNPEENVNFKGVKGGVKGALIGAAVATAVGFVTAGFGFAMIPMWTAAGAVAGNEFENENKAEKEDKKDKKDKKD